MRRLIRRSMGLMSGTHVSRYGMLAFSTPADDLFHIMEVEPAPQVRGAIPATPQTGTAHTDSAPTTSLHRPFPVEMLESTAGLRDRFATLVRDVITCAQLPDSSDGSRSSLQEVATAKRNVARMSDYYGRELFRASRAELRHGAGGTTIKTFETLEWQQAFIASSTSMAELRERMALLRERSAPLSTSGAECVVCTSTETATARGGAAIVAATTIFIELPSEERAGVRLDSPQSPVAVFASVLRDCGADGGVPEAIWSLGFTACALQQAPSAFVGSLWNRYLAAARVTGRLSANVVDAALANPARDKDFELLLRIYADFASPTGPSSSRPQVPLAVHNKVLRAVTGMRHDGGIRAAVVRTLRDTLTASTLAAAPWPEVADLLDGLDLSSAIGVLRYISQGQQERVPFAVWMRVFRRLCQLHKVSEAESMYAFFRTKFVLAPRQRNAVVTALLRMHCTASPPNFAAAAHLFTCDIAQAPVSAVDRATREAAVKPNAVHYRLLIAAADSADAAHALWIEALADGIVPNASFYRALAEATSQFATRSLQSRLPDFLPSAFDAGLSMPGDADAHRARAEALTAMGKRVVDGSGN
jgi:hypothetical protein